MSKLMRVPVPKSSLVQDFGDLLDNSKFSDLELFVGDKVFHVHKSILATRSPVFGAMFEHDTKERQENRISITDMDSNVVYQMLRFIYTDKVDTEKLVEFGVGLLVAADKVCVVVITTIHNLLVSLYRPQYDLKRLKALCEECLCNNLTAQNCVQMLEVANMHGAEQLKPRALDLIK